MLHRHTEPFLAQMGPLQDLLSSLIKCLLFFLGQLLLLVCKAIFDHILPAWHYNLLVNVPDEGFDEWRADFLDSFLEPHVIVQEFSLSRKDAQVDGKIKVLAVDDLDEAVLDILRDVKDS